MRGQVYASLIEGTSARATSPDVLPLAPLLDRVETFLRRYIIFPDDHAAAATVLWIFHAHVIEAAQATPYLAITSPTRECGKTRVLEVVEHLVPRAERASDMSVASLFRTIADTENGRATVLLDEADTIFTAKDEVKQDLRRLLNAGYRRGASVTRVEGEKKKEVRRFDVFGPKAVAAIGDLPETIASRCIPIRMRRRTAGEKVERYRERIVREEASVLREMVAAWAETGVRSALQGAYPELPDALSDRQQDSWEPLIGIADLAGEPWQGRARSAALALHGREASDESRSVLALGHIREVFEAAQWPEKMTTVELLKALCERDDGPWAEWWEDRISAGRTKGPASKLAKLLRSFDIAPKKIRTEADVLQGYERAAFSDAWTRYLSPPLFPLPGQNKGTEQVSATFSSRDDGTPKESERASDQGSSNRSDSEAGTGAEGGNVGNGQRKTGLPADITERLKRANGNLYTLSRQLNDDNYHQPDGRRWRAFPLEKALEALIGGEA